jgi:transcriptional regulator with XRE-family HTH domain
MYHADMTAGTLLRSARRSRHLTQRELAARAGVHQPAVADIERGRKDTRVGQLERLLRATGHRLTTLPTWAATAAETAEIVSEALDAPDGEELAFRALIAFSDGLAAQEPALRVALCAAEPAPSGDARFDAAIAAVAEHHLARLTKPAWLAGPTRHLTEIWVVDPHAGDDIAELAPPAFRRRGVLLDAAELASV